MREKFWTNQSSETTAIANDDLANIQDVPIDDACNMCIPSIDDIDHVCASAIHLEPDSDIVIDDLNDKTPRNLKQYRL